MTRVLAALALTLSIALVPSQSFAQEKKSSTPKVGKDQKVCNYKFPDGEKRSWVCDKDVPCCAWDAIKYVKCGNTITKCL